jgi:hypothetical protein
MSKNELLTKEEVAQATARGWNLHYVFNLPSNRWTLDILPTQFTDKVGAAQAKGFVVRQAQAQDQLSIKALRLITEFNLPKRKH